MNIIQEDYNEKRQIRLNKSHFVKGNKASYKGRVCILCRKPLPKSMRIDAMFCCQSHKKILKNRIKELKGNKTVQNLK